MRQGKLKISSYINNLRIVQRGLFIPRHLAIGFDDIGWRHVFLDRATVYCDIFDPRIDEVERGFILYNVYEFDAVLDKRMPWWPLYQEYLALAADNIAQA